jgi:hypothetical protein
MVREQSDRISGTTDFERSGWLKILQLEVDVGWRVVNTKMNQGRAES